MSPQVLQSLTAAVTGRCRLAVITGASGTIGKAIANTLFQHGMSVVLVGRRYDALLSTKEFILQSQTSKAQSTTVTETKASPPFKNVVELVACDVTLAHDVHALFATIDERFPNQQLDLLVNNAGINVNGTTDELSGDDFRKVMDVNVYGPFLCAQQAFHRMKKPACIGDDSSTSSSRQGGRIINIGSISSQAPRPDTVAYTTSKYALDGLTRSLALDGRPYQISVGIIHPGNVMSDLLTEEQKVKRMSEGFLSAESVANGVLYMATLPPDANVMELTVLPTSQPLIGRG